MFTDDLCVTPGSLDQAGGDPGGGCVALLLHHGQPCVPLLGSPGHTSLQYHLSICTVKILQIKLG